MKKSLLARPIPLLVAAIGAYHVAMFALHPHHRAVAKTEVVWGDLSDKQPSPLQSPLIDTAFCSGTLQPASDGNTTNTADATKSRVRFEYRPEADYFVNTGRAEEIAMRPGSTITIDNKIYQLKQIQFQNTATAGRMDFYLIHRAEDGKVAVVEAPLQIGQESNPAIDTLWRYMPQRQGEHNSLDDIHVDINNLLPHDRTYYRYAASGSCGKGVVWLGLQSPVQITADQLAKLDHSLVVHNSTTSL